MPYVGYTLLCWGYEPVWLRFSSQVYKVKYKLWTLYMVIMNHPLFTVYGLGFLTALPSGTKQQSFNSSWNKAFNEAHQRGFLHRSWVKRFFIGLN